MTASCTQILRCDPRARNCTRSGINRCLYPELYSGTWNQTATYSTPTLITRARFFQADPALASSTGNKFPATYEEHGWNYDVEHITGLTIRVRLPRLWHPLSRRSTIPFIHACTVARRTGPLIAGLVSALLCDEKLLKGPLDHLGPAPHYQHLAPDG